MRSSSRASDIRLDVLGDLELAAGSAVVLADTAQDERAVAARVAGFVVDDLAARDTEVYTSAGFVGFSYGQAQKWLNMAIKYAAILSLITDNSLVSETAVRFAHAPIDNFILKGMSPRLSPPKTPWSKWDRETYLSYMQAFRRINAPRSALAAEDALWTRTVSSGPQPKG